jgi:hypothetical protein
VGKRPMAFVRLPKSVEEETALFQGIKKVGDG